MNRIILIGNGFDLAHRLKTSYNDFIDWIIEEKSKIIIESKYKYSDQDITYVLGKYNYNINIAFIKGIFYRNENCKSIEVEFENNRHLINNNDYGSINYKNQFLKSIIHSKNVIGWADIETIFYDELNKLLDNEKTNDIDIEKFNLDFQRIIDLLEEYLLIIVKNKGDIDKNIQLRILELLNTNVMQNHLSIEYKINNKPLTYTTNNKGEEIHSIGEKDISKCLIVDFNYTKTIYPYLIDKTTNDLNKKYIYINIHGELNNINNQMIFGFGDELDENYIRIEKSRLNGVLKFIKSINYLKASNYREVLNFLELKDFQVYTWGHSCGLTDRTLLNHIFEHKNCAGIMPYYYQRFNEETKEYSNNYIEIVSNIARNFTDKNKLRDRVVNFQFCEPLIK